MSKTASLPADQLLAALREQPDILVQHPDLLHELVIPHGIKGATSLLERQTEKLRADNKLLQQQLADWRARAQENSELTARLFELSAALIPLRNRSDIATALSKSLTHTFGADAVGVCLPLRASDEQPTNVDGLHWLSVDKMALLLKLVKSGDVLCGPLDAEHAKTLFGPDADKLRSAALLALRGEHTDGLLAIGSEDPERFAKTASTDFLHWLAQIVAAALNATDD